MAGTTTQALTVAEFQALPGREAVRMELHGGEIVEKPPAKLRHAQVQLRLQELLHPIARGTAVVPAEVAYRPLAEHEFWIADVAVVSRTRWLETDLNDNLHGSPEIVIEVVSPANTLSEFERRERMCLATGAREFWVVYPEDKLVRVATADGQVKRYSAGDTIELALSPGHTIAVDDIFESASVAS